MTDKDTDNMKEVTDQLYVETKWGKAPVFKPGDEVVAWRWLDTEGPEIESQVVGKVRTWDFHGYSAWGGSVVLPDGSVYYPTSIVCLRKPTKLDKVLK